MNWRRGLFRAWAAVSVLWVVLIASIFYTDVSLDYALMRVRNTYEVTLPDGREIKIISPSDEAAARLAEIEKKYAKDPIVAPKCNAGVETCKPWDRQWKDSGLELLPGATVDAAGFIVGPYSIFDNIGYAEARANLVKTGTTAAYVSLLPPAVLALILLGIGWVVRGFHGQ